MMINMKNADTFINGEIYFTFLMSSKLASHYYSSCSFVYLQFYYDTYMGGWKVQCCTGHLLIAALQLTIIHKAIGNISDGLIHTILEVKTH